MPCARKSNSPSAARFLFEDVDERRPDDFALLFRIGHVRQPRQEHVGGIDEVHRQPQLLVALDHLLGLVEPQHAVVDEDAVQSVADRAVNERRGNRGIDAARQGTHDAAVTDLLTNPPDRFVDERRDRPVAAAAADVEGKILQDFGPAFGVGDFGMEQQRVVSPLRRFHRRDRCVRAGRHHGKPWRRGGDEVAMTGPDAQVGRQRAEKPRRARPCTLTAAKPNSRCGDGRDLTAEHVGHQLHAVADAQRRQPELEHTRVAFRCIVLGHALRTAGEDEADRLLCADGLERRIERQDLGIHRQLTQPSSNQLRELRAEIENENRLVGH